MSSDSEDKYYIKLSVESGCDLNLVASCGLLTPA